MPRRFLVLALVVAPVVVLVGCRKDADTCRADAAELGRYLTSMDHDLQLVQTEGLHLPMRDDLPKSDLRVAPEIRIDSKTIVYRGSEVSLEDLAAKLAMAQAMISDDIARGRVPQRDAPDPRRIVVVVDEAVPWARVATAVTTMAKAQFTRPAFVFARTPKQAPPPPSKIDDQLAKLRASDAGNKASELAAITSKIVESCPALIRKFGEVASEDSGDKTTYLLKALEPALVECNCDVDMPSLRTVMYWIAGNPNPTSSLELDLDPKAPAIVLPATTPWKEGSQRLTPTTKAVWFSVKT